MTPGDEWLHLAAGEWELEVQPGRGGAVTSLRHRGRAVLVSPDPSTADAMGAGCFALVPYANRIANGQVGAYALPRNFGDHPHPLHGTGWKRPWSVARCNPDAVEMQLRHVPDMHWPWAFSALQRISLRAEAVRFELSVANDSAGPAPMGVGFHPAFASCAATTLSTQLDGVWRIDAESLPVELLPAREVLPELPGPVPALRPALVDHCFTGWSRRLDIDHAGSAGDLAVTVTASPGMDFLQFYMPPGRNWFCAEPMSQMPDAVNLHTSSSGTGLRLLAPGEMLQVWMSLAVQDAGAR